MLLVGTEAIAFHNGGVALLLSWLEANLPEQRVTIFGALDLVPAAMVPTLIGASVRLTAAKVEVAFGWVDSRC